MAAILSHQPCPFRATIPDAFSMSNRKNSKDASPAFFKGEFSFVNKDARNIESKDHNAAVSWHVMNRYERFKKQEQARKLRASANIPIGSIESSSQQRQRDASNTPPQQSTSPVIQGDSAISNTIPPMYIDPWLNQSANQLGFEENDFANQTVSSTPFVPSSLSSPSAHSSPGPPSLFDPLLLGTLTTASTIDQASLEAADTSSIIVFAYESFLPSIWPTEPGNPRSGFEISRSWEDVASISQDECYDNAYLALLCTIKADKDNDPGLRYQSRLFQSQAIRVLRQRISSHNNVDLKTQKAILTLFSCETCVDSTAAARTHLKMLRNLVAANGGVILLDSWFREELLSCDCYFAVKYGTRPLFPAGEWTPGPLSQPWKARLVAAGMFGDHAASVDKRIEHPCLKALVSDLRELFKAQEYILTHDMPTEDQLLRWRQLRRFDCISRLADHHTNLAIYGHLYDFPKCQAIVTTAMVLLANMVLGSPEPLRFGTKLLEQLRQGVLDAESEIAENDAERLVLWVCYIGSLAERVFPQMDEHKEWFNSRVKQIARKMRLNGWDDIRKVIRHFLFSASLHDEIVGGRAHRTEDYCTGYYSICGTSWRKPLELPMEPQMGEASASLS